MKYLMILPGVLVLLVLIAVVRTLVSPRKTSDYQPPQTDEAEALRLAGKLSKMIQVDTTSHAGGDDPARFRAFHKTLAELFPRVFSQLEKTEIDGNLLFYWKGRSQERPILLMSHQDVVPAEGAWSHAPFSGDIADGKVWGRGASDTKCSVMAFFEAAEQLLAEGYTPPTDVYLASSCTEEWAGDGAPKLVAELQRRGVELFLVCDEGGAIISEPIGGIPGNFAMVGVFEKGKADVKFTAKSTGGHASAPGKHSATVSSPAVTVMRPSCCPAATGARTDASVSTDVRICAARAFSSRSGASLCGTGVTNSCVPSTTGTGGMPSSGSGVTSA